MIKIFKKFRTVLVFSIAISFSRGSTSSLENREEDRRLPMIRDFYFIYPSDVIDYSVSGSSLIEFNLNSKGEVENLQILESLGIPFDKSIIEGLNHYVSNEITSIDNNIKNQYRLEIKFEN